MSDVFTDILTRVTRVFAAELRKDELVLTPETVASDIEGWDSLTHMALINAVEIEFSIKFKLPEIIRMKNVGDMCRAIEKRMGG